jgi:dolichol-phosphate mannosyltransferase
MTGQAATKQAITGARAGHDFLLSIIIPCYNEQAVLPQLFARVTAAAATLGCRWEAVCVDDGSLDDTWLLLERQNQCDERWRGVSFARNFGHQIAVSAGLDYARGDLVAVLDADLQDPPEELTRFMAKWREGYDVVFAVRQRRKENFLKRFCYWSFYRLISRMVAFELPLDAGDLLLLDRRVVDVINAMPERARFVRGLRAWAGFKQTGLAYERQSRAAGEPKYTLAKLFKLAWDGIFSFSTVPLRWMSYVGLCISLVAMAGMVFTLTQRIFAAQFRRVGLEPAPGFATIVISILFLGGIQLFCLGVLGEYIGRIYDEVKGRPKWVVKQSLGVNTDCKS